MIEKRIGKKINEKNSPSQYQYVSLWYLLSLWLLFNWDNYLYLHFRLVSFTKPFSIVFFKSLAYPHFDPSKLNSLTASVFYEQNFNDSSLLLCNWAL